MNDMILKMCGKCQQKKRLEEFHKGSGKYERVSYCKDCVKEYGRENRKKIRKASEKWRRGNSEYGKQYHREHQEEKNAYDRGYAAEHREEARERSRKWMEDENNRKRKRENDKRLYQQKKEIYSKQARDRYERNKERDKQRSKQWRIDNPGKVNANIAKRRAARKQAIPKWADLRKIRLMYEEARTLTDTTGVDYEVDHYYPLTSNVVCGLHCEANLRIITAEENNSKKCKLLE